jgi:hypothetical protein
MVNKLRCAREEQLVPAVDAGGLAEMRISRISPSCWVLSVKLKTKRDRIYLATRRNPDEPRYFKRIEAAASVGRKLFHGKQFTLIFS